MRQCRQPVYAARGRIHALIGYRVRLADLDRHWFEIECRVEDAAPEQRFSLPAWIPGSYLLRDFARHVVRAEARRGGEPLAPAQVALLQVARATLGDPPLLLLDHVDAALDDVGRARLRALVEGYPGVVVMATEHPDRVCPHARALALT